MLKIWFTDKGTARKPALQPVITLWAVWEESGSMIYIFSMNNCKDSVDSLERTSMGKRSVAPAHPEQCWATIKFTVFTHKYVSSGKEMVWGLGGITQKGRHTNLPVPLRPLKVGSHQCLRPGLKFPLPCAQSSACDQEAWAQTHLRWSQAGPQIQLSSPPAPSPFRCPR